MFTFKTLLKSVGWAVNSSGDGLSAFSSSSDILTSFASGANGLGNSGSWFRIQSPDTVRELIFQNSSSSAWKIKYSAQAQFTGGSPNATTWATATDEGFVLGSIFSTPSFFSSDNSYRLHCAASNADGYGFYLFTCTAGTISVNSPANTALFFDPMKIGTFDSSDPDPFVVYASGPTNSWDGTALASTSSGAPQGWFRYGQSTASFVGLQASRIGLANIPVFPNGAGLDLFNGRELFFPILWARYGSTNTINPGIVKGVSTLLQWNGLRRATPTNLSFASDFDKVVVGDVNLPWNGTIILI